MRGMTTVRGSQRPCITVWSSLTFNVCVANWVEQQLEQSLFFAGGFRTLVLREGNKIICAATGAYLPTEQIIISPD